MNTNELCERLLSSCAGGMSALRAIVKLVAAGGDGDKVSPPTHEGGKYAFEERVLDGRSDVKTVLLDSSNRRPTDLRMPCLQRCVPETFGFLFFRWIFPGTRRSLP